MVFIDIFCYYLEKLKIFFISCSTVQNLKYEGIKLLPKSRDFAQNQNAMMDGLWVIFSHPTSHQNTDGL